MRAAAQSGTLPADHVPDLLAPHLRVLFCGTALGRISAQQRAYYANPGNYFWRALHRVGLTPRLFAPHEYPQLLAHGIGLTDLCKTAFGNDADLPADAFDIAALEEKIRHYQPRILAFTSKTGAAAYLGLRRTSELAYGPQAQTIGATRLYVLPSPSGQARIYWQEAPWQALARDAAIPSAPLA